MNKKTYKKVIIPALSLLFGIGLGFNSNSFFNAAKAENYLTKDKSTFPSAIKLTAKRIVDKEFIESKLYQHQWKNRQVVTLQFRNIPLLTFLDAPNYNALEKATQLAETLEQLSQDSINAKEIIVTWNQKTKDYCVKYKDEELVTINKYVRLPDSTDNLANDALQATNRLRRLMGYAEPLSEIKGKSKLIAKRDGINKIAEVKSSSKAYRGQASWYGPGFHGRRTASGEIFNQNALTAAHRSLPFGTKVKVTNLRNGRSVVVKINDRGPYSGGRIVDLSAAAASVIGMKSSGVAPVSMQILGR